jgi:hypothetical protein
MMGIFFPVFMIFWDISFGQNYTQSLKTIAVLDRYMQSLHTIVTRNRYKQSLHGIKSLFPTPQLHLAQALAGLATSQIHSVDR